MASFSKLNQFMRKIYTKNLFASNTVSCMVLLAVGDGITQYVEHKTTMLNLTSKNSALQIAVNAQQQATSSSHSKTLAVASSAAKTIQHQQASTMQLNLVSNQASIWRFDLDWLRNGKMFMLGTIIGPVQHFWYTFLDRQFRNKTKSVIIKKVILDQICFAPILNLLLIAGLHLLDGGKLNKVKEAIQEKFLTLYTYDCLLWVPAQTFNFNFISNKNRVLYVNIVTLMWNIISSSVMFNDVSINSTFE